MRSKFYQDFKYSTYDSNDLNLEYFEKWLAQRLTEMFNPIAAIIENTKQNPSDKNMDNKYNRQQESIFEMSGNNSNTGKQQLNLKYWFCNSNGHKVSLCPKIKDLLYPGKIKTIKDKKTVSIVYQILT